MNRIGKWIVAVAALAVLGGGGYFAYLTLSEGALRAAIDRGIAQLPAGYSATYQNAEYSPFSRQGSLDRVTLQKAEPQGFELAIDRIEFAKPDLDLASAWARAMANPASVTPETEFPLADRIALKGVSFRTDVASGWIGSVSGEGLRLYPWSLLQPDLPSWPAALAALRQIRDPANDFAKLQPMLRFAAAWGLAIGYDSYTKENLKMTAVMPLPSSNAFGEVNYQIDKMIARGGVRGTFADAVVEGYRTQYVPGVMATVEQATLSQVDMRKPMMALMTKPALSPDMLDGLTIGRIEYHGLNLSAPDQPPLRLSSVSLAKIAFVNAVPISGELAIGGIHVDHPRLPPSLANDNFARLGIDSLTISASAAYQWDIAQKRMTVPDVSLKVEELGSFDLSVEMTDATPTVVALFQTRLGHAILHFADHSLVERLIHMGATLRDVDEAAYRQQLVETIEAQAAVYADSPSLRAAAGELIAFIKAPQSLTIELAPPKPLPLLAVMRAGAIPPPQLATMLGLSVIANR